LTEIARVGLYTTAHLERDADRAAPEAERHMQAYFGTHTNNTSDLIGSPEQIARRLQPLVDEGLTMLVPRFVDPDLPRQTELLREALSLLRPPVPTPSA
jgi:alkanesulfonate monooxygenase SsuD/methylene tetrahydromethanopterin reductase-like flavin-dependent oxidoreductase (luciferase family)